MLMGIKQGDITSPNNTAEHIIIAMNTTFSEPSALGRPYVKDAVLSRGELSLGSVVTFDFSANRQLHMAICHTFGHGGWIDTGRHLRYALDHLDQLRRSDESATGHKFSIVHIGTGAVGRRDGANQSPILEAMVSSHLPVTLWILPETPKVFEGVAVTPLRLRKVWDRNRGVREFPENEVLTA